MRPTILPPSRRHGRRALAATAALGLALGLGACTIGETDDDDTPAAQPSSESASADPAENTEAETGAPDAPLDQLVLTSADAPDLGLQPVSAEEISGGMSAIGDLTEGMRVEPEQCADVNQDSLLEQSEPGALAIQSGLVGDTSYAVALTRVTDDMAQRAQLIEECPEMTVVFPVEGQELTTRTVNTLLDLEAPDGVEDFSAVSQDSSMNMMGQDIRSGTVLITGTVRDLGVTVTVTSGTGEVPEEARNAAIDAFAKQAEKVRAA